jgi:CRISPR system Cascade subunit CasB
MTNDSKKQTYKLDREIKFLEILKNRLGLEIEPSQTTKLKHIDKGGQAAMRRAMTGERYHNIREFIPYISEDSEWQEKYVWIPIACLFVYYPQKIEIVNNSRKYNFGNSCLALSQEINKSGESKGTERRFKALLDTSLEDLRSPINALVRQMKIRKIYINYPQLLADLQQWENSRLFVQDAWARAFWRANPPDKNTEATSDNAEESAKQFSEPAFARIWNNSDDEAYDDL